jgi:hypothetical protein
MRACLRVGMNPFVVGSRWARRGVAADTMPGLVTQDRGVLGCAVCVQWHQQPTEDRGIDCVLRLYGIDVLGLEEHARTLRKQCVHGELVAMRNQLAQPSPLPQTRPSSCRTHASKRRRVRTVCEPVPAVTSAPVHAYNDTPDVPGARRSSRIRMQRAAGEVLGAKASGTARATAAAATAATATVVAEAAPSCNAVSPLSPVSELDFDTDTEVDEPLFVTGGKLVVTLVDRVAGDS